MERRSERIFGQRYGDSRLVKIADINVHLICVICGGYYIDATTIIECLHSFCRACIVHYLERNGRCPICKVIVHKAQPLLNIRLDHVLQGLVYKLVPGLLTKEMNDRQNFYSSGLLTNNRTNRTNRSIVKTSSAPLRDDHQLKLFHSPNPDSFSTESLSICLEYCQRLGLVTHSKAVISEKSKVGDLLRQELHCNEHFDVRYLLCPAAFTVGCLKKFIRVKFDLPLVYQIDVFHNNECLENHLSMLDVAFIFQWQKKAPLQLFYFITYAPRTKRKFKDENSYRHQNETSTSKQNKNSKKKASSKPEETQTSFAFYPSRSLSESSKWTIEKSHTTSHVWKSKSHTAYGLKTARRNDYSIMWRGKLSGITSEIEPSSGLKAEICMLNKRTVNSERFAFDSVVANTSWKDCDECLLENVASVEDNEKKQQKLCGHKFSCISHVRNSRGMTKTTNGEQLNLLGSKETVANGSDVLIDLTREDVDSPVPSIIPTEGIDSGLKVVENGSCSVSNSRVVGSVTFLGSNCNSLLCNDSSIPRGMNSNQKTANGNPGKVSFASVNALKTFSYGHQNFLAFEDGYNHANCATMKMIPSPGVTFLPLYGMKVIYSSDAVLSQNPIGGGVNNLPETPVPIGSDVLERGHSWSLGDVGENQIMNDADFQRLCEGKTVAQKTSTLNSRSFSDQFVISRLLETSNRQISREESLCCTTPWDSSLPFAVPYVVVTDEEPCQQNSWSFVESPVNEEKVAWGLCGHITTSDMVANSEAILLENRSSSEGQFQLDSLNCTSIPLSAELDSSITTNVKMLMEPRIVNTCIVEPEPLNNRVPDGWLTGAISMQENVEKIWDKDLHQWEDTSVDSSLLEPNTIRNGLRGPESKDNTIMAEPLSSETQALELTKVKPCTVESQALKANAPLDTCAVDAAEMESEALAPNETELILLDTLAAEQPEEIRAVAAGRSVVDDRATESIATKQQEDAAVVMVIESRTDLDLCPVDSKVTENRAPTETNVVDATDAMESKEENESRAEQPSTVMTLTSKLPSLKIMPIVPKMMEAKSVMACSLESKKIECKSAVESERVVAFLDQLKNPTKKVYQNFLPYSKKASLTELTQPELIPCFKNEDVESVSNIASGEATTIFLEAESRVNKEDSEPEMESKFQNYEKAEAIVCDENVPGLWVSSSEMKNSKHFNCESTCEQETVLQAREVEEVFVKDCHAPLPNVLLPVEAEAGSSESCTDEMFDQIAKDRLPHCTFMETLNNNDNRGLPVLSQCDTTKSCTSHGAVTRSCPVLKDAVEFPGDMKEGLEDLCSIECHNFAAFFDQGSPSPLADTNQIGISSSVSCVEVNDKIPKASQQAKNSVVSCPVTMENQLVSCITSTEEMLVCPRSKHDKREVGPFSCASGIISLASSIGTPMASNNTLVCSVITGGIPVSPKLENLLQPEKKWPLLPSSDIKDSPVSKTTENLHIFYKGESEFAVFDKENIELKPETDKCEKYLTSDQIILAQITSAVDRKSFTEENLVSAEYTDKPAFSETVIPDILQAVQTSNCFAYAKGQELLESGMQVQVTSNHDQIFNTPENTAVSEETGKITPKHIAIKEMHNFRALVPVAETNTVDSSGSNKFPLLVDEISTSAVAEKKRVPPCVTHGLDTSGSGSSESYFSAEEPISTGDVVILGLTNKMPELTRVKDKLLHTVEDQPFPVSCGYLSGSISCKYGLANMLSSRLPVTVSSASVHCYVSGKHSLATEGIPSSHSLVLEDIPVCTLIPVQSSVCANPVLCCHIDTLPSEPTARAVGHPTSSMLTVMESVLVSQNNMSSEVVNYEINAMTKNFLRKHFVTASEIEEDKTVIDKRSKPSVFEFRKNTLEITRIKPSSESPNTASPSKDPSLNCWSKLQSLLTENDDEILKSRANANLAIDVERKLVKSEPRLQCKFQSPGERYIDTLYLCASGILQSVSLTSAGLENFDHVVSAGSFKRRRWRSLDDSKYSSKYLRSNEDISEKPMQLALTEGEANKDCAIFRKKNTVTGFVMERSEKSSTNLEKKSI